MTLFEKFVQSVKTGLKLIKCDLYLTRVINLVPKETSLYSMHDIIIYSPGPPTACSNIRINLLGDRRMDVVWQKPSIVGRDDFYYILKWSASLSPSMLASLGLSGREINGSVTVFDRSDTVSQSITGLRPETPYSISVTARNGVSDQSDSAGNNGSSRCQLQGTTLNGITLNSV